MPKSKPKRFIPATAAPAMPKVPPPTPIPDSIRATLNLHEEKDELLAALALEEGAILICAVAPYRSIRVSPVDEVQASIGLHEEFAFEAVIDEIETRGLAEKKIILLLNTFGGLLHSSFKVARALRTSFKEIEIYVPHIAASGGTLIALTGDRIFMGCMSQLSPLDPQVYYDGRMMSALNARAAYNRLCEAFAQTTRDEAPYPKRALADKLDPLLMEDWNGAVETAVEYATKILRLSNYAAAEAIAHRLVYHFTEHDADIDYELAKEVGLRVQKYDSTQRTRTIWRHFRRWLGMFLSEASTTHVVRYVLPLDVEKKKQWNRKRKLREGVGTRRYGTFQQRNFLIALTTFGRLHASMM